MISKFDVWAVVFCGDEFESPGICVNPENQLLAFIGEDAEEEAKKALDVFLLQWQFKDLKKPNYEVKKLFLHAAEQND
jgi:hypothetical protein